MKKAFEFIQSLKPSFYEVLGYPTIKVLSENYVEVYFDFSSTIHYLEIFDVKSDEFRLFPSNTQGLITCVFTFYND